MEKITLRLGTSKEQNNIVNLNEFIKEQSIKGIQTKIDTRNPNVGEMS